MPEIVNGMPCLFCQIVEGENPHYVIYEDEDFIGFLDKYPLNPGHTQLIPKKHNRWVWDMDNADIGRLFIKAKRVSRALQKVFETEWIIADTGGIGVPHAHIHLVPRYEDDGHGELVDPKISREITEDQMVELAEKIRQQLSKN